MEKLIKSGQRERALEMFLSEIVRLSPKEIEVMRARSSWPNRVASIDVQIREIRALTKYRFDAVRTSRLETPTLLLAGGNTPSPQLKQATELLMKTLSNRSLIVLEGEEHNAMDKIPQRFAEVVTKFLLTQ